MKDINEIKKEFDKQFRGNIWRDDKDAYTTIGEELWTWIESKLNECREDIIKETVKNSDGVLVDYFGRLLVKAREEAIKEFANKVESLIIKEIVLAQKEGSGTSRLTSFIVALGDLKQLYLSQTKGGE